MNPDQIEKELIVAMLIFQRRLFHRSELIALFEECYTKGELSLAEFLFSKGLINLETIIFLQNQANEIYSGPPGKKLPADLIEDQNGFIQELVIRMENAAITSIAVSSIDFFKTSIYPNVSNQVAKKTKEMIEIEKDALLSTDAESPRVFETSYNPENISSSIQSKIDKDFNAFSTNQNNKHYLYETCFEPGDFIAKGAIGIVYQARDASFARTVALKRLQDRPDDQIASQLRSTFLLEGEVTGRLDHPGVVPMYGLGKTQDGIPFYVMKFIDTPNFESLIDDYNKLKKNTKTTQSESNQYLRKLLSHFLAVCQTVHYAHDRGVLHCDIKPANVMTGKYGETYVVDWGMALLFKVGLNSSSNNQHHISPLLHNNVSALHRLQGGDREFIGGTIGYMSPEHYRANRQNSISEMTVSCDIFSLGAMLYQILTGFMPANAITDETAEMQIQRVRNGDFVPPNSINRSISKPLSAICMKAIASETGNRYQTVEDLAADIESWLADEPVSAYRENRYEKMQRWAIRNRTKVMIGVTSLLFLLFGTILFAYIKHLNHMELQQKNLEITLEHEQSIRNEAEAIAQKKEVEARELLRIRGEKIAISTINRFIDDVTNHPELKTRPDLENLRIDLLKGPMEYFLQIEDEFRKTPDTSEQSMFLLANGYSQLGNLISQIGRKYDSLVAFEKSITIFDNLTKTQPDNLNYQFGLIRALQRSGDLHQIMGESTIAEPYTQRAYGLIQNIVRKNSDDLIYINEQADIEDDLGVIYRATGRSDKARELFQKSVDMRERIVRIDPKNEGYKIDLARSYRTLGIAQQDVGKNEDARISYEKYLMLVQEVASSNINSWPNQRQLADAYETMGIIEENQGRPKIASDYFNQCRIILEKRLAEIPVDRDSEGALAFVLYLIANLDEDKNPESALETYQSSIKILKSLVIKSPSVTSHKGNLAAALKGAGICCINLNQNSEAKILFEEALSIQQNLHDLHPEQADTEAGIADIMEKIASVELSGEVAFRHLVRAIELQSRSLRNNPGFAMFQGFLVNHWQTIIPIVEKTITPPNNYVILLDQIQKIKDLFPPDGTYQNLLEEIKMSYAEYILKWPGNEQSKYNTGLNLALEYAASNEDQTSRVLALAYYRNGLYEKAIQLLSDKIKVLKDSGKNVNPIDLSILCLSQFRSGLKVESEKTFQMISGLMNQPEFKSDIESLEYFREANRLLHPIPLPEMPFQ
jgi:serine/threonine-protein kinase